MSIFKIVLCTALFIYLIHLALSTGEVRYCTSVIEGKANSYDINYCKSVMKHHELNTKHN